ncbi:hypothetical protein J6N69_06130 [bacterium]|nr:hypothetical protein [bacterium]MBP3847769.1 hypothetical protein [bacterium]
MKNYQLTTVNKYIELLDNNVSSEESNIIDAVEKYLYKAKKARANAEILDFLLA